MRKIRVPGSRNAGFMGTLTIGYHSLLQAMKRRPEVPVTWAGRPCSLANGLKRAATPRQQTIARANPCTRTLENERVGHISGDQSELFNSPLEMP